MDYIRGDLIRKNNIRFKSNNLLDFRIGGHPVAILTDTEDDAEHIYFLVLTSKVERYAGHEDEYYPVKPDKHNHLQKPSLIYLREIYKDEKNNIVPQGSLSDYDYIEMLKKLAKCQLVSRDECYCEVQKAIEDNLDDAVNN